MIIHSEQEMLDFGKQFARNLSDQTTITKELPLQSDKEQGNSQQAQPAAIVIELIGDVGTGKTTFTRGLALGLGIKEPVTSPSFTISKQYALPNAGRLIHYDFYRLPDPGLMSEDLAENLQNPNNIIVIEWGESVTSLLPKNHHTIKITYTDNGREVTI